MRRAVAMLTLALAGVSVTAAACPAGNQSSGYSQAWQCTKGKFPQKIHGHWKCVPASQAPKGACVLNGKKLAGYVIVAKPYGLVCERRHKKHAK
jgi:hypothetical protein